MAMRVLHVISSIDPRTGGPARALVGLTTAQAGAGLDVRVLATFRADEQAGAAAVAESLRAKGVTVELVGPTSGALSRHPDLAAKADEMVRDADVVHVHALWEEVQHRAESAARRRGVPYVVRPCGMLDPWSLSQGRWKKRLYIAWRLRRDLNGAAALHFTADAERDLTRPLGLRTPAIVEPNGLDLREFETLPERGTFRKRYAEKLEGQRLVLFLSRIHPKKGLDLLVPAFAKANLAGVALAIAGPDYDGYQAQVQGMIDKHGLTNRAFFTGMLQGADRVAAMADADLFVLPSYQENFGIAVAEALAAGTPVVISDQVNICEEVRAAGVGGVVPLEVDALARELSLWMGDEGMRREAAGKARPFVWERYDWERIARRWAGHYVAIAGGQR